MAAQGTVWKPERILVVVVLGYLVLLTVQVRRGQRTLLANLMLGAFTPFLSAYDGASRLSREGLQAYLWQRDAALESERTKAENRILKGQLLVQSSCQEENARLRQLLQVQATPPYTPVGARAMTQYGLPFNRYLLVSVPSGVHVPDLTPVITPEGVVGRMQGGRAGSLRCVLLTDPDSAIGIISQRTSVHGVAAGDGKNLTLRWVTNEADVQAGDAFVTSGDDGVFPPGIPVGTVIRVSDGPDYLKRAILRTSANMEDLRWVLLLLNSQRGPSP